VFDLKISKLIELTQQFSRNSNYIKIIKSKLSEGVLMMFKISTFLVEFCSGDERHISLDDSLKLREVFEHQKFTPEYIQLHIMIQYNGQIVVKYS
jgi:hypothetical protein